MQITFEEYNRVYKDVKSDDYEALYFKASREVDKNVTGVDGYNKLDNAYPTNEKDAYAVKMCIIELVHALQQIKDANDNAGIIVNEDGTVQGRQIKSVSSGSENITYADNNSVYAKYAADDRAKRKYLYGIISDSLSGIKDANGVNLLYMGVYPSVYR